MFHPTKEGTGGEKKLKPNGPDLPATLRRLTRLVYKNLRSKATIPNTFCSDVRGSRKLPSIGKLGSHDKFESVNEETHRSGITKHTLDGALSAKDHGSTDNEHDAGSGNNNDDERENKERRERRRGGHEANIDPLQQRPHMQKGPAAWLTPSGLAWS